MWHRPRLLNAISDLLIAAGAAAFLAAVALWAIRMPFKPIRQVVITEEMREVKRADVEAALQGVLKGNFFSINLEAVKVAMEKLPWVRRAEVRRVWPSRLEIRVEEQIPAARWGEAKSELVNIQGEVFAASLQEGQYSQLPLLVGPAGTSQEMLKRYSEAEEKLAGIHKMPRQIVLSPRLAWQLRLEDGMVVELGREQQKSPVSARLDRFIEVYPGSIATRQPRPTKVDLRYPNGFALHTHPATGGAN